MLQFHLLCNVFPPYFLIKIKHWRDSDPVYVLNTNLNQHSKNLASWLVTVTHLLKTPSR